MNSFTDADAAYRLGEWLGWPVLADIGSQGRLGDGAMHHDLALVSSGFADEHRPDAVVLIGGMPVSGRVLRFLESSRPRVWASIRSGPNRIDPHHRATHVITGDVPATLDALTAAMARRDSGWVVSWRDASDSAWNAVRPLIDGDALTEPGLAHRLSLLLPPGDPLVVSASMPIRDLDTFAALDGPRVQVFANRGASGIDGTVATAAGVARASGRGATLLIGDLALLHDLNSLALLRALPERLVIVVVNNDGGRIFGQLPIAAFGAEQHTDPFEKLFGTPHGMTFASAAQQFGLTYAAPDSLSTFAEIYREATRRDTSTLVEVRTDRVDDMRSHIMTNINRDVG